MASKQPYSEEFKIEAVKQIIDRGHKTADVSARLGVSQHSLYKWMKAYQTPKPERQLQATQAEELRRLRAELKRVTEERDISKKGSGVFCQAVRVKYPFIQQYAPHYAIRHSYKVMQVHPSGYSAWGQTP